MCGILWVGMLDMLSVRTTSYCVWCIAPSSQLVVTYTLDPSSSALHEGTEWKEMVLLTPLHSPSMALSFQLVGSIKLVARAPTNLTLRIVKVGDLATP